jgi:hypothetical protein
VDALQAFHVCKIVASLGAGNDGQILFFGFLSSGNNFANARAVYRDRLFGKNVLARFDGGFNVGWPESWRGCEDDDVYAAGKNLLIGIESAESSIANIDPLRKVILKASKGGV